MKQPRSLRHSAIRTIFRRIGPQLNIKMVPIDDNGQRWFHVHYFNGEILLSVHSKLEQYYATDLMRKFRVA